MRHLTFLFAASLFSLGLVHCGIDTSDDVEAADQAAEEKFDDSHKLFEGKWESVIQDVPKKGDLPFEANIRSMEFSNKRVDSTTHVRFHYAHVVRPGCDSCTDETEENGSYRSIADKPEDLTKGKVFTTGNSNQSSRDFYEFEGKDKLTLTATIDGKKIKREFRRVK
jgi:hypothetical protein